MLRSAHILPAALLLLAAAAPLHAQTGPAPLAEKNAITTAAEAVRPRKLIDARAAAAIWNMKPRKDETTSALEKRVEKQLRELLAKDASKLNYDTDYWRLLAYLREVPWDKMPESRRRWYLEKMPNPRLTDEQREKVVEQLEKKPIYKMKPKEIDVYLGYLYQEEPDLRKRVVRIARQNLGQPYDIYLLGEFPSEVYDPDPMFCLEKGDCVVFSEHVYAMALSRDWKEFYKNLQLLRYKGGEPGMTTRNHFTEADWVKNNAWLLEDITEKVDATTVTQYTEKIDRARFFKNFGIGQDIPVEMLEDSYIPASAVSGVLDKLQEGDFVNVVRGIGNGVWVGHVGLIGKKDGKTTFIHSTEPKSKEQPIMEYVNDNVEKNVARAKRGSAEFKGFKFLRLRSPEEIQQRLSESSATSTAAAR